MCDVQRNYTVGRSFTRVYFPPLIEVRLSLPPPPHPSPYFCAWLLPFQLPLVRRTFRGTSTLRRDRRGVLSMVCTVGCQSLFIGTICREYPTRHTSQTLPCPLYHSTQIVRVCRFVCSFKVEVVKLFGISILISPILPCVPDKACPFYHNKQG
jgi:hypothetical protein